MPYDNCTKPSQAQLKTLQKRTQPISKQNMSGYNKILISGGIDYNSASKNLPLSQ
jgi:hypothetical protein